MQHTNIYLGLLRERGRKGLPLTRVYQQLFNPKLYLTADEKIYRNNGAMTPGVTMKLWTRCRSTRSTPSLVRAF